MVLGFSDLNKTQVYKKPFRDSRHHEIEIITIFNYLSLFKPKEHTEVYHIRKPNDKCFVFEIENIDIFM